MRQVYCKILLAAIPAIKRRRDKAILEPVEVFAVDVFSFEIHAFPLMNVEEAQDSSLEFLAFVSQVRGVPRLEIDRTRIKKDRKVPVVNEKHETVFG